MYVHDHTTVAAQIEVERLDDTAAVAVFQRTNLHAQCLLILLEGRYIASTTDGLLALYSRRQYVGVWLTTGVFLNTYCRHIEHGFIGVIIRQVFTRFQQGELVPSPLVPHQLEAGKTQHNRLFKASHKHPYESDGTEILNGTNARIKLIERHLELVPAHAIGNAVLELMGCHHYICNVWVGGSHVGCNGNAVLEIRFGFTQGIISVQIFRLRQVSCRSWVVFRRRLCGRGVALRVIEPLVALKHIKRKVIVIATTEVVIVIAGRVILNSLQYRI